MAYQKAAKAAGVCPQTVSEYLHDPHFRQRIHDLRNRFHDAAAGQVIAMDDKARKRLEELLCSQDGWVVMQAIRVWKDIVLDIVNQYDLAKRIVEPQHGTLEEQIALLLEGNENWRQEVDKVMEKRP